MVKEKMNMDFSDAYIERCNKESEEVISIENPDFFNQSLDFLKRNKNEFIYIESPSFDSIGVDAISLELDDVFGTYDVMLGLKLPKKYQTRLKEQLNSHLSGEEPKFDLMFNGDDGLWDVNFTLNYVNGYTEELSIGDACSMIYDFLFTIVEQAKTNEV